MECIKDNLKRLCNVKEKYENFCIKYLAIEDLSDDKLKEIINELVKYLISPDTCLDIVQCFPQLVLCLLYEAIPLNIEINKDSNVQLKHKQICVVLGKTISVHPDVVSFAYQYFEKYPSPFSEDFDHKIPMKKSKVTTDESIFEPTTFDIVDCCYEFLKTITDIAREKWDWCNFIKQFMRNENSLIKWLACQCLAIVTGMSEEQLYLFIQKIVPNEHSRCVVEYDNIKNKNKTDISNEAFKIEKTMPLIENDFLSQISDSVVSVSGILLPIFNKDAVQVTDIVHVKSTDENLRKVALAIASKQAVCLQGPVGSGKTSLVEHLAALNGREIGKNFIKIQLGDQTDSKMLLGTYRCTDMPGEFIWQPGVLTQAVLNGYWVLLEDIDSCSMDVLSIISSLLETNSLNVPGFRDSIKVSPHFQLFVTQRLLRNMSGFHKQTTQGTLLIDKKLMQVNIQPLTHKELIEIVETRYSSLKTISKRIVDVYLLFSSGMHSDDTGEKQISDSMEINSRLISTRDLIKFCSRAVIDFDVSSHTSALKVFQDAIDIFCCSFNSVQLQLNLACQIASKLGIVDTKAGYFCKEYKPSIVFNESLHVVKLGIGRVNIEKPLTKQILPHNTTAKFCFTRPSACLLERIACCVKSKEPVLLVGETGVGKTSSVQYLANSLKQKLIVINMNQQSDSADLLGGYKPVDMKFVIAPLRAEFEKLFRELFDISQNLKFLEHISNCFNMERYSALFALMSHSQKAAVQRLTKSVDDIESTKSSRKRKMQDDSCLKKQLESLQSWLNLGIKLDKLSSQLKFHHSLAFAFIEGSLVKALQNGYWVLLDEINLASAETLECLSGLLEGVEGSLNLLERGDKESIKRHENFTLFACMNPATDVGKKNLPAGIRNRFTEFFVEELTEKSDLILLVNSYLKDLCLPQKKIESIVKFYLNIKKQALLNLTDGTGHRPHYSLRTLCRALSVASKNRCGSIQRSLYEAFCLSFLTQLNVKSHLEVEELIARAVIGNPKEVKAILKQSIMEPKKENETFIEFEGYWVTRGSLETQVPNDYILTASVRRNLKDLVRIVSLGKHPVLLQGDTSVGKTSLITYLAKTSGNKCVRINNHEHTDLQEYIGSYVADTSGKLVFKEGVLVEAMRQGYWLILDELNLAPSEVLEALNRVLDDNRELYIPETQETVKADKNFMLFATQNPPGLYGGRKVLSRAFRNRFVELHFDEIPPLELETILHERCQVPPSYCKKIISVMSDLQLRRRGSAAFAGKQGFITLRDLFRWGERYRLAKIDTSGNKLYDWDQHIADEGYLVLAGKVRKQEERNEIIDVIKKHIKRTVNPENLFTLNENTSPVTKPILQLINENSRQFPNIVWTFNMRKLAVMVSKAMEFSEPVLLVGMTGGGKTTVCQLIAENNKQKLYTVNCHMHTESSDFVGGLRPVRDHSKAETQHKLFEWMDGPLIQAMTGGDLFLADEISLADDSVLERLNSLLEPERTLLLAEKGCTESEDNVIIANKKFNFISTMNPGGDFGKKELSPALRNRFTEIWCDSTMIRDDMIAIIEHNITNGFSFGIQEENTTGIGKSIMDFVQFFGSTEIGKRFTISIRDLLTWVNFMNACSNSMHKLTFSEAYVHGAFLTFLDSFGSGVTSHETESTLNLLRETCLNYLNKQLENVSLLKVDMNPQTGTLEVKDNYIGMKPFYISNGSEELHFDEYSFNAPTVSLNTIRLLRGLQLNKAILLEGSPGVGKTSLVTALAKATGHQLLRINLSDQTDVSDLFGADLPLEGGRGGEFCWRDGPFLRALKEGHWILLDELNLASQSVLEGLNACLDHRGEVYIPELDKTFKITPGTRLFACQNPLKQGGSRKGLPQSFLNRFTQVYISILTDEDYKCIMLRKENAVPKEIINKMIEFNQRVVCEVTEKYEFGHKGGPWEFNLRDIERWCQGLKVIQCTQKISVASDSLNSECSEDGFNPGQLVKLLYSDRLRTSNDKKRIVDIYKDVFGICLFKHLPKPWPLIYVTRTHLYVGDIKYARNSNKISTNERDQVVSDVNNRVLKQMKNGKLILRMLANELRSLLLCVLNNWMAILVGSSSTCKSSLVHTLATLTGNQLRTLSVNSAMDTTEILGGFEQTDYHRHLEEVSSNVDRLVTAASQHFLVHGELTQATSLLAEWQEYKELCRTGLHSQITIEETQLFLSKLQHLKSVMNSIRDSKISFTDWEILYARINNLEECILREGNLNSGGRFEWVDSVLIKCLQDGSWLLIDNVNLCSPAVLDRLNALLEPNGVLTIGERGVKENGKMVEIKPHPNFRLFLTMDPKNGEISRAMRNRGVEIFFLNNYESTDYENNFDYRSFLNDAGLKNTLLQKMLITLHEMIIDDVVGEKPNLSQLIHSGFLISQQIARGLNLRKVLTSTIEDVYIRNFLFKDTNMNSILKVYIDYIDNFKFQNEDINYNYNQITLDALNMQTNSEFAMMKQKTTLLNTCLEKFSEQNEDIIMSYLKNISSDYTDHNAVRKLHIVFINIAVYVYQSSSLNTTLLDMFLEKLFKKYIQNFTTLSKYLHMIKTFSQHINQLKSKMLVFNKDELLPWDLRWYPELLSIYNTHSSRINAFALLLYFDGFVNYPILNRPENKKTLSIISYSQMVYEQKMSPNIINNKLVLNFFQLIKTFDKIFKNIIIQDKLNFSDKDFAELISVLMWRLRLYNEGTNPLLKESAEKKIVDQDAIANVMLHFKWFRKWTLSKLFCIAQTNKCDVTELIEIMKMIDSDALVNPSPYKFIIKEFIKHYGKTLPYASINKVEEYEKYRGLIKNLSIQKVTKFDELNNIILFLKSSDGVESKERLMNIRNSESVKMDIKETIQKLKKSNSDTKDGRENMFTIQLIPIYELLTNMSVHVCKKYLTLPQLWKDFPADKEYLENCDVLFQNCILAPLNLSSLLTEIKKINSPEELSDAKYLMETMFYEISEYFKKSSIHSPLKYIHSVRNFSLTENVSTDTYKNCVRYSLQYPIMSYTLTNLLIDENSSNILQTTSLNCYKKKIMQLSELNSILWKNTVSFSAWKYDYVYNEIEFVFQQCIMFVNTLSQSMGFKTVIRKENIISTLNTCTSKIQERLKNCCFSSTTCFRFKLLIETLQEFSNLSEKLMNLREIYVKKMNDLNTINISEHDMKLYELKVIYSSYKALHLTGNITVILSHLKMFFTSNMSPVDPVVKRNIKLKYFYEEQVDLELICQIQNMQNAILSVDVVEYKHPFYNIFKENINNLKKKIQHLNKSMAVRPEENVYNELLKDLNISSTIIDEAVKTILPNLNKFIDDLLTDTLSTFEDAEFALKSSENWVFSQSKFCENVMNKYEKWYPDILMPIVSCLSTAGYGIQQLQDLLFKLIMQYYFSRLTKDQCSVHSELTTVLTDLIMFPSYKLVKCNYDFAERFLILVFKNGKDKDDHETNVNVSSEIVRLKKSALQYIWNSCTLYGMFGSKNEYFKELNYHLQSIVELWNKQEDEKEKKKKEEEELYVTRSKPEDEDEILKTEMRELFPNIHEEDFSDIKMSKFETLDDQKIHTSKTANINLNSITDEDISFIADLHSQLVKTYTKSEWLNPTVENLKPDYISPLIRNYKIFSMFINRLLSSTDYHMDRDVLTSFNFITYYIKSISEGKSVDDESGSPVQKRVGNYDFYHSPNIEEIKSSYAILENLQGRVKTFLAEWPEHPTLESINIIIDRILNFSITSPISRFLIGLELLLVKCKEWEENAHAGVSLATESYELTHQIIAWRKLELSMWKNCLNNAQEKVCKKAARWWFFIYNIVEEYVSDKKNSKTMSTKQVIETLQKFIETSDLGEFKVRLNLLYTFHCHCVLLKQTKRTEKIVSVLWNLYKYYIQFLTIIETQIKKLRAPIEKKLKDFVKIARWNDINYWSIKETVEKTHRTLHKFIKEFEGVLKTSVTGFILNSKLNENTSEEQVGIWDQPQKYSANVHYYTFDVTNYLVDSNLKMHIPENLHKINITEDEDKSMTMNINDVFTKSRTLSKSVMNTTKYSTLIQNIDTFIKDVIETSNHLKNLEVNTGLSKEKQKSSAKNILQQKRKALTDLYKNLNKFGLSYKLGLLEEKLSENLTDFYIKPIDLKSTFSSMDNRKCDGQLLAIWDGCEVYYFRSVARLSTLNITLKKPSPDLGIQNIERLKGYSYHLMILARKQKFEVIKTTRNLYSLRNYVSLLSDILFNNDHYYPLQNDREKHEKITEDIKLLLIRILYFFKQLRTYMNACPEESNVDTDLLLNKTEAQQVLLHKNEKYSILINKLEYIMNLIQDTYTLLEKSECTLPQQTFRRYLSYDAFSLLNNKLDEINSNLNSIWENLYFLSNTSILRGIRTLITEFKAKSVCLNNMMALYTEYKNTCDVKNISVLKGFQPSNELLQYKNKIEKFIKTLLLVVQKMYKNYNISEEKINVNESEIDTDEILIDDCLSVKIIHNLLEDLNEFNIDKIISTFSSLFEGYKCSVTNLKELKWCRMELVKCIPLLDQITMFYQYFVTQQIFAYRVTCKLSSVLYNIFIELCSKGFCIPPELSEESGKGGQQGSQSGMGLGEGTGEKDVSDRIESEDQLEEAKKQEEYEKEKEEEPDCKEEEGGIDMNEDFEGKHQDINKDSENESDNSDNESVDDKEMGETGAEAEKLDREIWGDEKDEESENENDKESEETKANSGEQDNEESNNDANNEGKTEGENKHGAKTNETNTDKDEQRENDNKNEDDNSEEIKEMNEPEYDDDQINPYHGTNQPPPEPEAFDLPEEMQLDDEEGQNADDSAEENPFDIDNMKDQELPNENETNPEEKSDKQDNNENKSDDSDDEDGDGKGDKIDVELPPPDEEEQQEKDNDENNKETKEEQGGLDEETEEKDKATQQEEAQPSSEQNVTDEKAEAMEVDQTAASNDNVQSTSEQDQANQTTNDNTNNEENPDETEGIGQAQNEQSSEGHQGQMKAVKENVNTNEDREVNKDIRRKLGKSDAERSLGDTTEPFKKKLKTIDTKETESTEDKNGEGNEEETYQHVKESKKHDTQVMDAATNEQAEQQTINKDEEKSVDKPENSDIEMEDEPDVETNDVDTVEKLKPEKVDSKKYKDEPATKGTENEEISEAKMDIEGESVETTTVKRGNETSYHTQFEEFEISTMNTQQNIEAHLNATEIQELRKNLEQQLSNWHQSPTDEDAERAWSLFSSLTSGLARDLSEQLRLVLEPTQTSRLKGDYRTGRRINMRKVIPYIASQFRKDKIWLRRTKPSKREYQIVLAIDDSQSMADNHSKELAFESLALLSSALTLLESGQLGVLSFGESTEILHRLSDQFTDRSGSNLLQKFTFAQKKTCVAKLVDFVFEMFETSPQMNASISNARLLIVVSDGRGVFSEGEVTIQHAVRRAKLQNIFMIFIIIDNPESKDSVLDIRMPIFKEGKLLGIKSYLDNFPFPFYLILKDINQLPSVLSDALRQWFELLSNVSN